MVMRNCGRCGKPLYNEEQLCKGCQRSLAEKTAREQRRYERAEKLEERFQTPKRDKDDIFWVDDDLDARDAQDVWVDRRKPEKKRSKKRRW